MVAPEPTRTAVKRLKAAGFTRADGKGSHAKWSHPSGVTVSVPDGHRTQSPGLVRKINDAIKESEAK